MRINIYALDGAQFETPLASFVTVTELNQWLQSPRLPRYFKTFEWCYDDLSTVLRDGGDVVLGGCLYSIGSGLADWASFHLEVLTE